MVPATKDHGIKIWRMVMVNFSTRMVINMKVTGIKIKQTDMVYIFIEMGTVMKEIGQMISKMGTEQNIGLMVLFTKAIFIMD